MDRNIKIAYLLSFLFNTYFWLGIWVFFYLLYTNYTGIGILELALYLALTLSEIPTGAIADLFGKKRTLILSFFLSAVGLYMMGIAPNYWWVFAGVFIAGVGGSFNSGTYETLIYDTLKEKGHEKQYDKVISRTYAISFVSIALCSLIGGYLYTLQPGLPFIASAVGYLIGMILCFFLREPIIDTIKFSLKNFLRQTRKGLSELFKNTHVIEQTILLLSIGVIVVVCDEMLNSFVAVEYGFKPEQLAVLFAVVSLAAALASHFTPKIKNFMSYKKAAVVSGALIGLTLILSPIAGIITGAALILLRSSFQAVYQNLTSILINEQTESEYRATTLSTFSFLENIPYMLTAVVFGASSDIFSAKTVAMVLGIILLILVAIQLGVYFHKSTRAK